MHFIRNNQIGIIVNVSCLTMTYEYLWIKPRTTTLHCRSEANLLLRFITGKKPSDGTKEKTQSGICAICLKNNFKLLI